MLGLKSSVSAEEDLESSDETAIAPAEATTAATSAGGFNNKYGDGNNDE